MSNVAETFDTAMPSDQNIQQRAVQGIVVTADTPLFVKYTNNTNGEQPTPPDIRLVVQEEGII